MRKLVFTLAALAAFGLTVPVATSAYAEEGKVVIKTGDRGHHRGWNRSHNRKVVVVKRHRGLHRGWRNHHASTKVVIKNGHRHHHNGGKVVIRSGRD